MSNEPPFLHHGRANSIDGAILLHGGEALAARQAYEALQPVQRDRLLEFLRTLQTRAPGSPDTNSLVPHNGIVGEEPAIKVHISQTEIDAGQLTTDQLRLAGAKIFDAHVNAQDGAGRPESTGDGLPRPRREYPQNVNRISGPDGTSS